MKRLPKLKRWEPILLEWTDSSGPTGGWAHYSDNELKLSRCVTVGQMRKQTKRAITLQLSRDKQHGGGDGLITVPVFAITKFVRLGA